MERKWRQLIVACGLGIVLLSAVTHPASAGTLRPLSGLARYNPSRNAPPVENGQPTHGNWAWVAGAANGHSGNAHWWLKSYWAPGTPNRNLDRLRADGHAQLEVELYNPGQQTVCDKFTGVRVRDITFPNAASPIIGNGCGNGNVLEEVKVKLTNTKGYSDGAAARGFSLSVDAQTVGAFQEGSEVNFSWVPHRPFAPDADLWLGKLNLCAVSGSGWSAWNARDANPDGLLTVRQPDHC